VETEPLVGFFANTIVLRVDLAGNPSFRELVRRVRETALGAYAHQDLPFEKIVEVVRPVRDPGRNPIFQANFRLSAASPSLELEGITAEPVAIDPGISRFDLALDLAVSPAGLVGYLEYDTALFSTATAARLTEQFLDIAAAVGDQPDRPIAELAPVRRIVDRRRGSPG
jgi:non-ribosomal peptide synthetase component F